MSKITEMKLEHMIEKLWSDIDRAWEGCCKDYEENPRRMLGIWADAAYRIGEKIKNDTN